MKTPSFPVCLLVLVTVGANLPAHAQNAVSGKPSAPVAAEKPRPSDKWELMDYGPVLAATIVAQAPGANIANKGIAIKLGSPAVGTAVFDTDLMRWSAVWTGGFLNYTGIVFDGSHGPNPSIKGELAFCTAVGPGWGFGDMRGEFVDPRERPFGPLPKNWAKYRGHYLCGDRTVVSYTVGETAGARRARRGFGGVHAHAVDRANECEADASHRGCGGVRADQGGGESCG